MDVDAPYDVIVIGSGAAGSTAALELGERGLRVLVLEAGRDVTPQDAERGPSKHGPHLVERAMASLTGQPLQARVAFFSARLKRFLVNDLRHRYLTPAGKPYLWIRGRQVGGRMHVFGRVLHRWSDHEFRRSAGSLKAEWPIGYDDLKPYYAKAERNLEVHGNLDGAPTAPDGEMSGPALLTEAEVRFKATLEAGGFDRQAIGWRMAPPDTGALPIALAKALAMDNVTLRTNAVVSEILTDPFNGQAHGVRFIDKVTRVAQTVATRSVVVCASPIESIRLLLNSKSARHPAGIGNANGLLGRFFMDQPAAIILARFPGNGTVWSPTEVPAHPRYGTSGGVYVLRADRDDGAGATDALGCSYQGSIGRSPHVKPSPSRDAAFMCFGEMLPHSDNAVTLDPRRRDPWGVPLPVISCSLHDEERQAITHHIANMVEMIEAGGGTVDGWVSPLGLEERGAGIYRELNPLSRWIIRKMIPQSFVVGAAIHETGGVRMGNARESSILNSFNQCWDAPNVFVTDASSFPTSGVMGTTLTVMALTLRACQRLASQLAEGTFHTNGAKAQN